MDWKIVKRNWAALYESIDQRWPAVDEDDLDAIDGNRASFIDYIAKVNELTRGEAEEEVDAWVQGELPADVYMDERHDNDSMRESGRSIHPGEDVYSDDRLFGDDNTAEPPVGREG